jgi:predicted lactoylglutathione lyase
MEFDGFIVWSTSPKAPGLALTKPYDGKTATIGNGVMVALAAGSKDKVNALHRKALELGARDEGQPGPRGEGFYAAYFRDPDGNKLNAFYMGA